MSADPWYVAFLSSIASGLVGATVAAAAVYYFGIKRDAKQRRCAYLDRQLSELYAPLAGLRKQIRAKSDLRKKVYDTTEDCLQRDNIAESKWRRGDATINYHNKQFLEDIFPKYRDMLALFTDKYHLADADTRTFYFTFLEFVEIWNMSLAKSLAPGVFDQLGHGEDMVEPFYEHLETKMQQLQDEIARG